MTSLDPSKVFTVGVDLGGTNLRFATSRVGAFTMLDELAIPTGLLRGRSAVMHDLSEGIQSMLHKREAMGEHCAGICVGSPGPLELPAGILRNPPNLTEWNGFDLRSSLEASLQRPVRIEGDANVAALAELYAGAGKAYAAASLCMLTLGTGVGNGLILNGSVWHGMTGMGGEGGHIIVEPDGAPCGCGGRGCLEQYASATAIARIARERGMGQHTAHELAILAESGDINALQLYKDVGRWIAIALTSLINTLNLPLYVIGGGVVEAWPLFAPAMFEHLREYSYVYRLTSSAETATWPTPIHGTTFVLPAKLGGGAGLLGACLAAQNQSPPNDA